MATIVTPKSRKKPRRENPYKGSRMKFDGGKAVRETSESPALKTGDVESTD